MFFQCQLDVHRRLEWIVKVSFSGAQLRLDGIIKHAIMESVRHFVKSNFALTKVKVDKCLMYTNNKVNALF